MIPQSASRNPQTSIEVHIEELLLHGLPLSRGQSSEVQAAVETELARLLTEQGLNYSSSGFTPDLSAASIEPGRNNQPGHLGLQIAQAIYGGLAPTPNSPQHAHSIKGAS